MFGVPVLAGSACEGKRCFPGPVPGCFLVVEDLRPAVSKMISEPSTCCGRISLPGWERKHFSGCVLVVTGSLLHVSLGIHDVFGWGQDKRSQAQRNNCFGGFSFACDMVFPYGVRESQACMDKEGTRDGLGDVVGSPWWGPPGHPVSVHWRGKSQMLQRRNVLPLQWYRACHVFS